MYEIDCSDVSEQVTDFVFDSVQDELGDSVIKEYDYTDQVVRLVDTAEEGHVDYIVSKLHSKAHEKLCDMEYELRHNPQISFEYSEDEVLQMKENVSFGCFTTTQV